VKNGSPSFWLVRVVVVEMAAFEDLGVLPELMRAVSELSWLRPTPIQVECIPLILGGGDVLAAAETGSGTHTHSLPLSLFSLLLLPLSFLPSSLLCGVSFFSFCFFKCWAEFFYFYFSSFRPSGKTGAFALPLLQICWETIQKRIISNHSSSSSSSSSSSPPLVKPLLSVDDRDVGIALDESCLLMQSRNEFQWEGCRGTVGVTKGKYYYEMTVTDEGLGRVGWSTKAATLDLGTDAYGFGYGGTGKKSNAKQFSDYGVPYKHGDTVGCFIDADDGVISYSVNGKVFDAAFRIPMNLRGFAFYPAIVLKNAEVRVNFGSLPLLFPPPPPFLPLSQAHLEHIVNANDDVRDAKGPRRPIALIMEPSRELAEQTYDAIGTFQKYLTSPSLTRGLFVGGGNVKPQISLLKAGLDIAIGTPGRLLELIQSGEMDISGVRFFVLDEADRLLDTGNNDAIQTCYKRLKKSERLQVLLFSATLHSPDVHKLAESICQFPIWVDLKGRDTIPETVDLAMIRADPTVLKDLWHDPSIPTDGVHRRDNVSGHLKTPEAKSEAIKKLKFALVPKIIDAHNMDQALIFCRTRVDCDNLESYLIELSGGSRCVTQKYSCCTLHSGKQGSQRKDNYQAFKDGEVKYLICTGPFSLSLSLSPSKSF
jgi:ATP-dependent RNA helicase DDX1